MSWPPADLALSASLGRGRSFLQPIVPAGISKSVFSQVPPALRMLNAQRHSAVRAGMAWTLGRLACSSARRMRIARTNSKSVMARANSRSVHSLVRMAVQTTAQRIPTVRMVAAGPEIGNQAPDKTGDFQIGADRGGFGWSRSPRRAPTDRSASVRRRSSSQTMAASLRRGLENASVAACLLRVCTSPSQLL